MPQLGIMVFLSCDYWNAIPTWEIFAGTEHNETVVSGFTLKGLVALTTRMIADPGHGSVGRSERILAAIPERYVIEALGQGHEELSSERDVQHLGRQRWHATIVLLLRM